MPQNRILNKKKSRSLDIQWDNNINYSLPISLILGKCIAIKNMTLLQQYSNNKALLTIACNELVNVSGIKSTIEELVKYHKVKFKFNINIS